MLLWSDRGRLEMAAWWRKAGLSTLCLESGEKVGQERELVDLGGRVFTVRLWSGPRIRSCKLVFPQLPTRANLGPPCHARILELFVLLTKFVASNCLQRPHPEPPPPSSSARWVPGWAASLAWLPRSALGAVSTAAALESLALLSELQFFSAVQWGRG